MSIDNKIIRLIFFLMPISLLSGSFIPDLLVSIISIFFIFKFYENKISFFEKKFILFFIIFYLIIIFSIIFVSPSPIVKQGTSIFYLRFSFFSLALYYFFNNNENILNFSKVIFFTFIVLIIDSFIQFYFGKNIIGIELIPTRVSSFFGDEWIMGSFVSKIFSLNLIFISLLKLDHHKKIYLYSFVFIFSLFLIFLSGERTSLGMFLFQAVFIFILLKYNFYKKLIFLSLFLILSFSSLLFLDKVNTNNSILLDKITSSLERFEHGFKNYISLKNDIVEVIPSHKGHYITAYNIYKDNKLFGAGIKSFRYLCNDKKYKYNDSSCSTHPHNIALLFISELGIIGFLIYTFFIIFLIIDILRNYLKRNLNEVDINDYNRFIFIGIGILSTILPILPNGNFFNNYMSIMFYLLMGYYLFLRKNIYKKN